MGVLFPLWKKKLNEWKKDLPVQRRDACRANFQIGISREHHSGAKGLCFC